MRWRICPASPARIGEATAHQRGTEAGTATEAGTEAAAGTEAEVEAEAGAVVDNPGIPVRHPAFPCRGSPRSQASRTERAAADRATTATPASRAHPDAAVSERRLPDNESHGVSQ